jgi:outer membrane protein OmpA-like peptidoglycan-associated protein
MGRLNFLLMTKKYSHLILNPISLRCMDRPGKVLLPVHLVTCTTMKIEVDNFKVYQDNPPVNVAPNLPKLTKVNLGTNINTRYTEKWPYVSPDGKTLYYVVQGDPENKGTDKADEIYYSIALTDSTWDKRQNIGWPLNNDWPNCVISATPDNNTLYLMHTYNTDGSPKGAGFSMTTKTANGWSGPVDLKVKNYYNKGASNEFCFSADRKVLLMSIRRDETFGENDIYASFLQENGEFSEPKNLGNTVNTFAWECSPFLAPDGVTLYYSTAGYPGFGNADIFMTRRLDSTWTNWSTPINMGPDINSSNWEAYYSVAASGKYAYVVSTQNGIEGSLDIYQVKLPEVLKPKPVVLVYGKVLNSKTKELLESNINYNILATNKEIGIASSGVKDGSYKIVLPAGEVYSFLAKKNGFYSVSENLDVSKITEYKELERNLYLAPIEVGGTIRLNNLFFDFNKSSLRKESYPELDRVIKLLNENSQMEIEISGHTDNVGTDEINNKLSQDRSMSVKTYILSKGITSERIISKGYGKTKPVADNKTEEGRQRNRRVEFTILKK